MGTAQPLLFSVLTTTIMIITIITITIIALTIITITSITIISLTSLIMLSVLYLDSCRDSVSRLIMGMHGGTPWPLRVMSTVLTSQVPQTHSSPTCDVALPGCLGFLAGEDRKLAAEEGCEARDGSLHEWSLQCPPPTYEYNPYSKGGP